MTSRLIGLMSLVLLLSLAAFALLLNSYHAGVMDEVTRTISTVGRETLRTFEKAPGPVLDLAAVEPGAAAGPGTGGAGAGHEARTFRWKVGEEDGKQVSAVVVVTHLGVASSEPGHRPPAWVEERRAPAAAGPPDQARTGGIEVGATIRAEDDPGVIYIRVDDVRAEADPAHGTTLRIPTWEPSGEAAPAGPGPARVAAAGAQPRLLSEREIVLPIPTGEFHDLFADFRRKTLFLFLGVFMLGTVLSASLAAHFTRPIRRLDAGIRRLTEGDLEVEIEAGGKDEIGRLARAFNEMTRRLRAGRERERELTRRERLSALGRLAAGVAHDVRNPLHAIGLTLQNLQETTRPDEPSRRKEFDRAIAIIRDEIRRLDRLVENFLRFARSDRRARVEVDLGALLRQTADLVEKEAARRGVAVRVETASDLSGILGDPESIRSSLLNLVLNSFEAMPGGGALSLSARREGAEVVVEVADTGRGIPSEEQDKVFDFAYTTRDDGHGLGLAMVHQVVVEDHGGRVSLSSRPEEGTRVRLSFPSGGPAPEPA